MSRIKILIYKLILTFNILITLSTNQLNAAPKDFMKMSFLDENLRVGASISYSKLEANSDVGNYYLLSQANPRIDVAYDTGVYEEKRQRVSAYVKTELFRPENPSLRIKSKLEHYNWGLGYQPMYVTESNRFSYGAKVGIKSGTIVSELPNIFSVNGDIATRYSGELGFCFNWFGQTVSKYPLNVGLELLYSVNLLDNSVETYYNGFIYRFSFEFDFKKKTLFSGWNIKGFYSYEDVKNSYSRFVDKELGLTLNKVFVF